MKNGAGRPYRSKWGRRLDVEVTEVHSIRVYDWGIIDEHGFGCTWNAPGMSRLARLDGIDPPTGLELKRLLFEMNKSKQGAEYQIIRWRLNDRNN